MTDEETKVEEEIEYKETVTDYHTANKIINEYLADNIDKSDHELFYGLRYINLGHGTYYDFDDLRDFISRLREQQNHISK